ncbi:MAG TPA: anti-sigma factor antagonist [Trueperaceae bacterium]
MPFQADLKIESHIAIITLTGELDAQAASNLRERIEEASTHQPRKLVFVVRDLSFLASAGLRTLVFARQKMHADVDVYIVGAHGAVTQTIELTGFHHSVTMLDDYDEAIAG